MDTATTTNIMAGAHADDLASLALTDAMLQHPTCITWSQQSLGVCVQTGLGVAGIFIGYSSILFWMCAQAPQIYMNFKNGNADSLSPAFLATWLVGDITNFVGSVLAQQLSTQIVTAGYFVIVDILLCSQWLFYTLRKRNRRKRRRSKLKSHSAPTVRYTTAGCTATLFVGAGIYVVLNSLQPSATSADLGQDGLGMVSGEHTGRVLFGTALTKDVVDPNKGYPFNQTLMHSIGYGVGILSATLYVLSRLPQIIKNFRRKSTGGLSFVMFLMAILGNVTYAMAVFIAAYQPNVYDDANERITVNAFLADKLPWLVGSLGTLLFDFTIFIQFWVFGDKSISASEYSGATESLLDDEGNPNNDNSNNYNSHNSSFDSTNDTNMHTPGTDTRMSRSHSNLTASPLFFPASKKSNSYKFLHTTGGGKASKGGRGQSRQRTGLSESSEFDD